MANFSSSHYESPETGVELDWGKVPNAWNADVKALYLSIKNNEFSKFFYQTDIHMIRLTCSQHTNALANPDTSAAEWKTLWDQWDKFGLTMRSRANIRYTLARAAREEDYTSEVNTIIENAFAAPDEMDEDEAMVFADE